MGRAALAACTLAGGDRSSRTNGCRLELPRVAGAGVRVGTPRVDGRRDGARVVRREQRLNGDRLHIGIGEVREAVDERMTQRFGDQVQGTRGAGRHRPHVEVATDIQRLEGGHAAGCGGQPQQAEAAIVRLQRRVFAHSV